MVYGQVSVGSALRAYKVHSIDGQLRHVGRVRSDQRKATSLYICSIGLGDTRRHEPTTAARPDWLRR
jgi:hypothetical protein